MKKLLLFVAFSATAIGVQAKEPVDNLGAQAISVADYTTAEAQLTTALKRSPDLPEALLNMAYVYRSTGRASAAMALYQHVLAIPSVDLIGKTDKPISSHDIARRGMAHLQVIASR
ncbi:MAG: tetratricopeptide repeat protein [Sphingomonadaceae bacterium]